MLEQWADLAVFPVDCNDEETGLAVPEKVADPCSSSSAIMRRR